MPAESKEAQRSELHKTIWRMANELRGSVDGWDFKSYVLGLLFYRFISENLTTYINRGEHKAGTADFDYTKLPDMTRRNWAALTQCRRRASISFPRSSSSMLGPEPLMMKT